MTQWRLIALCNLVYKIISKILTARLKVLLPEIISLNQSAFIEDRLITDNILIVHEILHSLKKEGELGRSSLALKLDMAKTYDRVEWPFVEHMMRRLGIDLSFGVGSWSACLLSLLFGKKCPARVRKQVGEILQLQQKDGFGRYLGLSADFGASKQRVFEEVRNKINAKLMGWSEQYLSQAGKEVLIKAVAMAMPNYAMSYFQLPINLCKEIEREIIRYWWKGHKEHKGIHWVGWQRLSMLKEAGGMGFRDLRCFNLAMLAKIGWQIIKHLDSLLATTYRDKYFRSSDFMSPGGGRGTSWGWKGILQGRKILEAGMRWRIGNGHQVRTCIDKWVPSPSSFKIYSRHPEIPILVQGLIDDQTKMWNRDLILRCFNSAEAQTILSLPLSRWGCDDRLVWHFTTHGGYSVHTGYEFALTLWKSGELGGKVEGECSYGNDRKKFWKSIWRLQVPPKIRAFVWRSCQNALAVKGNLRRRSVDVDNTCVLCGCEGESQVHIFFRCEHARVFWFGSSIQLDASQLIGEELVSAGTTYYRSMRSIGTLKKFTSGGFGLWRLWKTRNSAVFEGSVMDPTTMVGCLHAQVQEYRAARVAAKPLINELPRPPDRVQQVPTAWTKPPHGWVKANWTELGYSRRKREGLVGVIRDSDGWLVQTGGV
ncbi:unnamed protein product [Prunus armeniaca]|uniref:Reverse transcriptase domain-containing protein n=1 Tax=Prunus armeniaca TaxID=36596 RepID=A0A6J5WGH5_PRUAR|nr:unnamed protein product [Prunus armeniaca]